MKLNTLKNRVQFGTEVKDLDTKTRGRKKVRFGRS